jgi:hypothetical protein
MINRYMEQLVAELRAGEVGDPPRERFLLAAVWDDLCRLAGEEPPPHVRIVLEELAYVVLSAVDGAMTPAGNTTGASQPGTPPRPRGGER